MAQVQIVMARKVPGAKIFAETVTGEYLILKYKFAHRDCYKLAETVRKINSKLSIDSSLWRPAHKGEY